ncbi:uncharacterized protein CC84DRAFT_1177026 [Paraphaeosphaeria sporulosa]|uniref:Uncharacterized protein n=1 Tax=Paraphaeosphaeria sporulosa TaxID=1460663 RepID=A0A177CDC2_9PLEO|nr:uncharacterized protein CC84DRAFT_1177026 [Paraphaeosphaeria sporulosa]OAG04882.1 hypothetical protein CC84DRAFT_1177026 [Paraphaeosphaeria sporulosa]
MDSDSMQPSSTKLLGVPPARPTAVPTAATPNISIAPKQPFDVQQDKLTINPNGLIRIPPHINQLLGSRPVEETLSCFQVFHKADGFIRSGGVNPIIEKALEDSKRYMKLQALVAQGCAYQYERAEIRGGSGVKAQGTLFQFAVGPTHVSIQIGEEQLGLPVKGFVNGTYSLVLSPKRLFPAYVDITDMSASSAELDKITGPHGV